MRSLKFTYKDMYIFFLIINILCLPLNAMNIGSFGSALKVVAILPIGIAFLTGGKIALTAPIRRQFLFTIFAACSIIWSVSAEGSIGRAGSYALLFVLLISGAMFKYTDTDIKKVKCALAWSSRLTAIVMVIFSEYVGDRFMMMGIIEEDPNYLCAYFLFGVIYSLNILTSKSKASKKAWAIIELFLYFGLVLISGSRGGLLAVGAAVAMYLLTYGDKKTKHIEKKIVLIILIVVLMIVMIDHLPETLRLRFTVDNVIERGGAGRTTLWKQTVDLFANGNLFRQSFGYGTATIIWCFSYYGYSKVKLAHNMFLETLAELGVIGFIIYSAAVLSFIKTAFKAKDKFAFAVIIGMLVMSMSTSIYAFKPYFNIMLFIIIQQNSGEFESMVGISRKE